MKNQKREVPVIPAKVRREVAKYVARLRRDLVAMNQEYDEAGDGAGIDERFETKLKNILNAGTVDAAIAAGARTKTAFQIHLLSEWAKGKIEGKVTALTFQKKSAQALSLAKMFQKRGDVEAAQAQVLRSTEFERRAKELSDLKVVEGDIVEGRLS